MMIFAFSGVARAEDEPKPEVLKKMYTDTLAELKAAQDRKAQLAMENEKLAAHVAELEKQLAAANVERDQLKREAIQYADRTFFFRTHYASWMQFIERSPLIRAQWEWYLNQATPIAPALELPLLDTNWPLGN